MTTAYRLDDTIAAVASGPGGAARGILRLSGWGVRQCVVAAFRPADPIDLFALTGPTAMGGSLRLGAASRWLPCQLYLWPTGRSFTGEPAAEIHTLGSPPLLEAALKTLAAAGARPARPGEFTLRAFLNGRLDLTQAEAVLGAVDAADAVELDVALAQLAGGLAGPLGNLREELVDLLAHLEAGFDFADEDLPFITTRQLQRKLSAASRTLAELARRMEARHAAGDQLRVVLVGWPNTGKSSLFNALLGKTAALVSDLPATTRDYLTAKIDLGGVKCMLVDTAGVELSEIGDWGLGIGKEDNRDASNPQSPISNPSICQAAQAASARQTRSAHIEAFCVDSTRPLNSWERSQLAADVPRRVIVITKTDAVSVEEQWIGDGGLGVGREGHRAASNPQSPISNPSLCPSIPTSSVTGQGLDALRDHLRRAVLTASASGGDVVAGTAVRCHESLRRAAESLGEARQIAAAGGGEELVAAELRAALEELGRVVGAVYSDDILDRIFSRFCIGK